jgi:hypothetical protein
MVALSPDLMAARNSRFPFACPTCDAEALMRAEDAARLRIDQSALGPTNANR